MHHKNPIVYLAGKIKKNDWRHDIVPNLRNHVSGSPSHMIKANNFTYAGPYFGSCDHGCYHTSQSHGAMTQQQKLRATAQKSVFGRCLSGVQLSDLVIIYISDDDCYGTLNEIGWVQILKKDHVLIFAPEIASKHINEFWFSTMGNPINVIYGISKKEVAVVIKNVIDDYILNSNCGG